ncbi:MAG: hypothetical protein NTV34_10505, partial [Proteobacteria bacterium]|nr:hypothetical protein [Pseudomonadota bacterium]
MKQVMCGILISVFSLTLAGCKTTKVSPTESSVKGTGAIRSLKCLDRGTVYYLLTQYGDLGTSDKVDR